MCSLSSIRLAKYNGSGILIRKTQNLINPLCDVPWVLKRVWAAPNKYKFQTLSRAEMA